MDKQEIFDYLDEKNIWHEITEHEAVFSMEEAISVELPYPQCDAKNLFIRDDKKRNYYMITVCGPKRVDLKEFRQEHGTRRLSFASAEDLWELIHIKPGSVSPLGLLNNQQCNVKLVQDRRLWCVDHGLDYCYAANLLPERLIGDGDRGLCGAGVLGNRI